MQDLMRLLRNATTCQRQIFFLLKGSISRAGELRTLFLIYCHIVTALINWDLSGRPSWSVNSPNAADGAVWTSSFSNKRPVVSVLALHWTA